MTAESVRASFVERFGEEQAAAVERAASEHGVRGASEHSRGKGSDPFKWALCICIGWECITRPSFREHHGITAPVEDLKTWIREHGGLDTHDGDFDYLALFVGAYNEYMPAGTAPANPGSAS